MTEAITSAVILGIVTYRAGKIAGNVAEDFLKRALAPVGDAAGKVLAHPIAEWQKAREKRAVEIVEAAAGYLDAADVEAVAVPGRTLFPLLQHASLEEHPDLQRMFAILLANAAHPQKQADLLPSFVSILSQLSPVEAVILERVYLDSLDGQDRIAYSPSGTLDNVAKMRLLGKSHGRFVRGRRDSRRQLYGLVRQPRQARARGGGFRGLHPRRYVRQQQEVRCPELDAARKAFRRLVRYPSCKGLKPFA